MPYLKAKSAELMKGETMTVYFVVLDREEDKAAFRLLKERFLAYG